jgi:methionine-rich copper-binding protein CopC
LGHGTLVSTGVYSFNWDTTTAPFGVHGLMVKVTDDGGLTGSSNVISITMRIPGDGNGDNIVDGEDYGIWQNGYNHPGATMNTGDYNGDGVVDGEDYGTWQNNYNRTAGLEDVVAASSADVAATTMVGSAAPKLVSVTPTANTVSLVFDTDVVVGGSAVEVTGLVSGPQAYTAAYDAATKTLTLTFASGLSADTYTVRVIGSFVVAADGGASLDGDAQAQFSAE